MVAVGLDQHLGPRRHADHERLAVDAVTLRSLAVAAAARLEVRAAAEVLEVAQRVVAHEHDIAAAAAVAAVGAALGHVRLTPEAEAAIAAGAGRDVDACPILHAIHRGRWYARHTSASTSAASSSSWRVP